MRLFIAFDISKEAETEVVRAQDDLKKADAKLSLVKEFHLTLKFLGEVDEKKLDELKERLKKVSFEPFYAHLGNTGVFPSEDYVRVVWIGIEPKDKISELQQKIEDCLEGMFEEDTRFHPHLTLARVKFVKDKKAFMEKLKSVRAEKRSFKVESFKLMKSTLTPEGPVYEVLEEYKL